MLGGFYIYRHIRPDKNEVFYIGKGYEKSKSHSKRYLEKCGRNDYWKNIVRLNNGKYRAEKIFWCDTEDEINKKEIEFISLYGRFVNGGTLCNMTDGGDGSINIIVSDETRKKLSKKFSGENHPNWGKKLSNETCRRKSESMKNSPKNLKGKKLPNWWKEKISKTKIGEQNPMYGKRGQDTPNARLVLNLITGVYYDSVTEASVSAGMKMKSLYNMLSGKRNNKTNLTFV